MAAAGGEETEKNTEDKPQAFTGKTNLRCCQVSPTLTCSVVWTFFPLRGHINVAAPNSVKEI